MDAMYVARLILICALIVLVIVAIIVLADGSIDISVG